MNANLTCSDLESCQGNILHTFQIFMIAVLIINFEDCMPWHYTMTFCCIVYLHEVSELRIRYTTFTQMINLVLWKHVTRHNYVFFTVVAKSCEWF